MVKGGGHMQVVFLPKTQPTISGGEKNYRPGDLGILKIDKFYNNWQVNRMSAIGSKITWAKPNKKQRK